MAKWVSQSNVPSISPATRQRTAYLLPLRSLIEAAIQRSLDRHPQGEEVTLDVLSEIDFERVKSANPTKSPNVIKQDLGLFIALTLVDMRGAINVETLRREDGRSVSSRRNTRAGLSWVGNYAPHRIVLRNPRPPRILLDTSVVRKLIHGELTPADVQSLIELKGEHPVSVADGALPELAMQMFRGSIPLEQWRARIHLLDDLLDPEFPVAPGGRELASFWGAGPRVGVNLDEARAYYAAAWRFLRRVETRADLDTEMVFVASSGKRLAMSLSEDHVRSLLATEGDRWSMWVHEVAAMIRVWRGEGKQVKLKDLRSLTMSWLVGDMGLADAERLDLVVRVLADRAWAAAAETKTPYDPKGDSNDPLDLDLLYGIPLPAWVCTLDLRLHSLARHTGSQDADKVMTPEELIVRLQSERTNLSNPMP